MMKGICLRYASNEMEAEDILQEAFIQAFHHLKEYKGKGALGGWLRKITLNKALEQYRKNKSIRLIKERVTHDVTIQVQEDVFQQLEMKDLLFKIQRLPLGYRTIFNLYAVEGYTHKEIGELLKISSGTSKSQFSRAKTQLNKMILDEQKEEKRRLAYAKR